MKDNMMTENEFHWEVFQFNQRRNAFELNGENELKMLAEETDEYFGLAKDTADRLDALVDFEFVFLGTRMKVSAKFNPVDPMIDLMCQNSIAIMETILMGELGFDEAQFEIVHAKARAIVVHANAMKGQDLDEDGKVIKGDIPNATDQIRIMLDAIIVP